MLRKANFLPVFRSVSVSVNETDKKAESKTSFGVRNYSAAQGIHVELQI